MRMGDPQKAAEIAASTNRYAITMLGMYGGNIIMNATNGNYTVAALFLNELYNQLPDDGVTRFDAVNDGVVMTSFDSAGSPIGRVKMNADQITNSLITMKRMMESVLGSPALPPPTNAPSRVHMTHCDQMTSTDFTCFSLP